LVLFFRKEHLPVILGLQHTPAMERSMPDNTENLNIVLVLQGGGALGAYHIGAYQAMAERGFLPDWICGISIGAINAAILAGNPPQSRLSKLERFWQTISWPEPPLDLGHGLVRGFFNTVSNAQALTIGQPHFFSPRALSPVIAPPATADMVSFYDTTPLLEALPGYADFDLINSRAISLSLGATNIETGELVFFDNKTGKTKLGPHHVVASGSLPPGFPATRIGDAYYWDGGCVSNTPLDAVLQDMPSGHTVVFMIDLWRAEAPAPRTLGEVIWREKQIQYSSRIAAQVDAMATKVNLRHALRMLERSASVDAVLEVGDRLDIVHITYHPEADQISSSDAEFSRESIADRSAAGHRDMVRAIEAAPWFHTPKPSTLGAMVHRVSKGTVTTLSDPNLDGLADRRAD